PTPYDAAFQANAAFGARRPEFEPDDLLVRRRQGAHVHAAQADVVRIAEVVFVAARGTKGHRSSVKKPSARALVGSTAALELVGEEDDIFRRCERVRHR